MNLIHDEDCYSLKEEVAIEEFTESALIFLSSQRRIIEINHSAKSILNSLDGKKNVQQLIQIIADKCDFSNNAITNDIHEILLEMRFQGVIKPVGGQKAKRSSRMEHIPSLLASPDVSFREESGGAILFNTDTNGLMFINPTGVMIWKFIRNNPKKPADIVRHISDNCTEVPMDQIEADVNEFVMNLQTIGFIKDVLHEE